MSHSTLSRVPVNPKPQPRRPRPRQTSEVTDVDCMPAGKGTGAAWMLNIWQGPKLSTYWLLPLTCPEGIAFQFQASRAAAASLMQADAYDVALFFDGCTCDCPGFSRHGHCKHVAALRLILERGEPDLSEPGPAEPPVEVPDPDDLGEPCGSSFDPDIPEPPF
jgi:hypothetical protein